MGYLKSIRLISGWTFMDIQCAVCGKSFDTKKEEITVTTDWILEEAAKMNNVSNSGSFPRVAMVCSNCWNSVLKNKPGDKSCYWVYNSEI
jgi:hypothetical protein